ncbi:MAG TPA: PPC domain-containing DNA-binding protein [Candidatus Saccharimonadales bacterium]|nr:PPC domain-containing DNA-binding protein [Candidatus Saccharimonadales bacterium]
MNYRFDGYNYIIVLKKGEELVEKLLHFIEQSGVKSGWVEGIGGAMELEIGFYDLDKKNYKWQTYPSICEIDSLKGSIAHDDKGEPVVHLHGVFSGDDFEPIGGHVKRLVVGGTCELFIHAFQLPLVRQFDGDTGLKTLQLD